jgi:hypothetical protein
LSIPDGAIATGTLTPLPTLLAAYRTVSLHFKVKRGQKIIKIDQVTEPGRRYYI